jgi:hypothetical protein
MPETRECDACGARFELIRSSDREFCYACQPIGSRPPRVQPCGGCGKRVLGKRKFCEPCAEKRERARLRDREPNRQRLRRPTTIVAEKQCSRCRQVKPASAFYAHRGRSDGLASDCADCYRARRSALACEATNG